MSAQIIVELVVGLLQSEHTVKPPFVVVLPTGTSLMTQYIDGGPNDRSLGEVILHLPNVRTVRVGSDVGIHLEHHEG
jgi:hypothetical protein